VTWPEGCSAVEGPMTDDRPWKEAASYARNHQRWIGDDAATAAEQNRSGPSSHLVVGMAQSAFGL
jgi:hypothetical protein